MTRSIVLFAHNEAAAILGAIAAVRLGGLRPDDTVTVLINGSTDQTLSLVQAEALRDPRIRPVNIALGDKANAWDLYVHRLADPKARMHVFIDGDVRISAGALDEVEQTMQANPQALVVSTLPRGGRQSTAWAARILEHHGMPGNFYAVPNAVFRRLQAQVWLPVGFMGDDTLLRWLFLHDLDPAGPMDHTRIKPCATAFFDYESFPMNTRSGLWRLWRRHLGYTRREIQMHTLYKLLKTQGLGGMPRRIGEIYGQIRPLHDTRTASVGFRGRRLLIPFVAATMRYKPGRPSSHPMWFEMPQPKAAAR
jgi:glycosyltransferase involved in cell wall biosynthesis